MTQGTLPNVETRERRIDIVEWVLEDRRKARELALAVIAGERGGRLIELAAAVEKATREP